MPLSIHNGDITKLDVDAIVNAANEALAPGGGVCGAIHAAAGPELARACAESRSDQGSCPTGSARITPGFKLPARHVIHAVGPVWHGGGQGEADLLAGCYRESLKLLREAGGRSIAFPAISTGIFGYPADQATEVAVETVRGDLAKNGELEVIFCVFGAEMETLYKDALR